MQRRVQVVEVHPGNPAAGAAALAPVLAHALDGSGPAAAPAGAGDGVGAGAGAGGGTAARAGDTRTPHRLDGLPVPDGVALVVTTSGSTGEPRAVLLDAAALRASATATHDRLGGPGRWLLTLPLHHVAGVQVLVRSLLAGTTPVVVPARGGFDPLVVASALAALPAAERPRYASLVPTQLHRVLALADAMHADAMHADAMHADAMHADAMHADAMHADAAAAGPVGSLPAVLRPWADLDAILVGGAATTPALLARARAAGLRVVTTYGATETSGGCVYDGVPLAGVRATTDADGVVHLTGPTMARGYLGRPDLDAAAFVTREGRRWFRTGDLGEVADGVLRVHGRADDVVVTGGVKVAPAAVEAVLAGLPGVAQVCVVGVPDDEWGQRVVAVVVPAPGVAVPSLDEVRGAVRRTLGAAAAPRGVVLTGALPERGPGKVDRAAVTLLAATDR